MNCKKSKSVHKKPSRASYRKYATKENCFLIVCLIIIASVFIAG